MHLFRRRPTATPAPPAETVAVGPGAISLNHEHVIGLALADLAKEVGVTVGHARYAIQRFESGAAFYHLASCECTWSERTVSLAAAVGALGFHLKTAQPYMRWDADAVHAAEVREIAERYHLSPEEVGQVHTGPVAEEMLARGAEPHSPERG